MYFADIFTVPANLVGTPAISIPSGTNADGLPYGLHLTATHLREDILFTVGKDFESAS
jgi:aspartyl-tRNA(Asn)/glutamyl-tRNA(Gln) amidotransferase subunit A